MKFLIVFVAVCVSAVLSGPIEDARSLPALKHEELHEENSYKVEFETHDGTLVREEGRKVNGPEGEVFIKSGSFRYISPEGLPFEVTYHADENGYQASGQHLPKPAHQ